MLRVYWCDVTNRIENVNVCDITKHLRGKQNEEEES